MVMLSRLSIVSSIILGCLLVVGADTQLRSQDQPLPESLLGHTGPITAVNYTPSGELIVTSSSDTSVRLWQAATGKEVKVLLGHTGQVTSVAVDPSGRVVLSGAADNTVRLWDIPRADPLLELAAGEVPIQSLVVHGPSHTAVSGGDDGLVRVWNLAEGKELYQLKGHTTAVVAAAYRTDANQLATLDTSGIVRLWDPLLRSETYQLGVHAGSTGKIFYHPNNQQMMTAGEDGVLRTWNLQVPPVQLLPAHAEAVSQLRYSPNGQLLLTSDGKQIAVFNATNREQVRLLEGQVDAITALAISANSQLAASGNAQGQLRLWNVADGADRFTVQAGGQAVSEIVFHPDNQRFTSSHHDGMFRLWKTPVASIPLPGQAVPVTGLAIRPDGQQAVTAGANMSVQLWNPAGGAAPTSLEGHTAIARVVRYRNDGQKFVSGDDSGALHFWNSANGASEGVLAAHGMAITDAAFNPGGTQLITSAADGTWKQWALPLVIPRPLAGLTDAVQSVAMSKDGSMLLVGGLDKTVRVYGNENGNPLRTLAGHTDAVTALAVDLPGQLAASGSEQGAIRFWNPVDGTSRLQLLGHVGAVRDLALLPEGKGVVSAGADGTIRHWRLPQPARPHAGHTMPVAAVGSSADGSILFSGGADKIVRLFNRLDGAALAATAEHADAITAIVMSADKSLLVSADKSGAVSLWPQKEGAVPARLLGHDGEIVGLFFATEEKRLISVDKSGVIRWWQLPVNPPRQLVAQEPPVTTLAVSTDGTTALVGAGEAGVRVVNTETSDELRILAGQDGAVTAVAQSRDGKETAAGTVNGVIQLWNTADGTPGQAIHGHAGKVLALAFGKQPGQVFSGGEDGIVRQWQSVDPSVKIEDRQGAVTAVAYSADRTRVAVAQPVQQRAGILVREVATGKVLYELLGHQAAVTSLAFDASGKKIVSGSTDKTLRVWDLSDAKFAEIASLEHPGPVTAVSFNKDASQAFGASSDNAIHQWNLADKTEIRALAGHGAAINQLRLFGDVLVSGSADATVRSWNVTNGAAAGNVANTSAVTGLALSPDGNVVAAGSADNMVRLWNRANGQAIATLAGHTAPVASVQFSLKGDLLISSSQAELRTWSADGIAREAQLASEGTTIHSTGLVSDGDNPAVLIAFQSNGVVEKRQQLLVNLFVGHEGSVTSLDLDQAAEFIVSGGMDKTVRQWNATSAAPHATYSGPTDMVHSVSLSADGKNLFAGSQDKNVYHWVTPQAPIAAAVAPMSTFVSDMPVRTVSASADGSTVASAGDNKFVTLWDAATGLVVEKLAGHAEAVLAVSLSADGTTVVSGSADKTARRWQVSAQRVVQADTGIIAAAANLGGAYLATVGTDKVLRLWDGTNGDKRAESPLGNRVPSCLSVSTTGDQVVVGDAMGLRKWTVTVADDGLTVAQPVAVGEAMPISLLAHDSAGRLAVVTADNKLQLLSNANGAVQEEFVLAAPSPSIAIVPASEDGSLSAGLLTANANSPTLQPLSLVAVLDGHEGPVASVAVSPAGMQLFSGGDDKTVRHWDLVTHSEVARFAGPIDKVTGVALVADGSRLFATSIDKTTYSWDVPQEPAAAPVAAKSTFVSSAPVHSLDVSADGSRLVTSGDDKQLTVWDTDSGLVLESLVGHLDSVSAAAISADGATVASGSSDKTARWWHVAAMRVVQGDEKQLRAIVFNTNGASFYTAGEMGGVKRWAVETAESESVAAVDALELTLVGDAQDLLTIDAAGRVEKWSAENGESLLKFSTAADAVTGTVSMSALADGSRAVVGHGKTAGFYSLESGELLESFPQAAEVATAEVFADGSRVIIGLNSAEANLVNSPVSALAGWRVSEDAVASHVLSSNGQFFFTAGAAGSAQMRSVAAGELVRTFGAGEMPLERLAVSANGQLLAAASEDKSVYVWTINTENAADLAAEERKPAAFTLVHPAVVASLDFSNNSARLVTGSADGRMRVWESASGRLLEWFAAHQGPVLAVDYKDDQQIASGGMDKSVRIQATAVTAAFPVLESGVRDGRLLANGAQLVLLANDGKLVLVNTANGTEIRTFEGAAAAVSVMAAAADNSQLVGVTAENELVCWTINNGQVRANLQLDERVTTLAFSPDNEKVAAVTADNKLRVISVKADEELRELYELTSDQPIASLWFEEDNRHLLTGHANGLVRRWLYASPDAVRTFTGHGSSIYGLAFNHDSKIFASASLDQTIRIWDVAGGNQLKQLSGHQGAVYSVAFSPDGSLLVSCGADKTLRLWDVLGGRQLKQVSAADAGLYSVTMNADGKRVAVAGLDKKIRVFDLLTGELLNTLDRHEDYIYRIRYNKAGDRLLSCGYGGHVVVWNAANGEPLFERKLNQVSNYADLAPDGSRIIIAGGEGIGHFVDVSAESN